MKIPDEVLETGEKLETAGFSAYLVGGCVRDVFLGRLPKDWDIATDARPEEIQKIFSDSVYENTFGTVGIKTASVDPQLKIIEVTTFRIEGNYADKRHPDEVKFTLNIEDDLSRRDFTINAMAIRLGKNVDFAKSRFDIIDPFSGKSDLEKKIIRTVLDPDKRFSEDALRLMRAIRFAAELGFSVDAATSTSIKKNADSIKAIAEERIRDEFSKIIMARDAAGGIKNLADSGLLKSIVPELCEGVGVSQNKHHIYSVFEHGVLSLDYAAKKNYSFEIRTAALLHDIGKPKTKRGEGSDATFYNHEMVGAKMTRRILERLRFSKEETEKITHLVRYHLFYYNVGEVTEAGVRRFLQRIGAENVSDFIRLREADRIGSGVPKAVPYKLRHLLFMIEKVKRDPISPKMLAINGTEIMDLLGIAPGPRVGFILSVILDEVIDDPRKNAEEDLSQRAKELNNLSDIELKKMAGSAKERKDEFEAGIEESIKKQFYVK